MDALTAVTVLNGLLTSATQISAILQKAHAEGRDKLTPEEWAQVTSADDTAREMLNNAIKA
jgi:hypothetical protein